MGWEVKIYNQNRSALLRTLTPDAPGGLDGDLEWQLDPHSGTVNLQLNGRNDTLGLPPRGVVTLTVDGAAWFHGIAPDVPSTNSPDAETVLIAGGTEALRVTLMDGKVYRGLGVYAIARDILARLCPPALVYDPAQIGDGSGTDAGPVLETYYAPTAPLTDVLKALAATAQADWGVDEQGRPHLGRPDAAPLAVAYTGQAWRRLPSQGRETCTQAVLRVVSAPSLPSDGKLAAGYIPRTVTTVATHADHALYNAARAVEAPEGVAVVKGLYVPPNVNTQAGDPSSLPAVQNPEHMTDGNPDTYTTIPIGYGWAVFLELTGRCVGYQLTYEVPEYNRSAQWDLANLIRRGSDVDAQINLAATNGRTAMTVIVPPRAAVTGATWPTNATVETSVYANPPTPTVNMWIYDFKLLVVDEDAASAAASAALQVPFAAPAEIALPGLVAPTPTVTVTGSPDGDVTTAPALFVYKLSAGDGRQTLVRLGSTGQDQTVRALKWAVQS